MDILEKAFWGNTIQQWLVACLIIVGSVVLGKVAYWVAKNLITKVTARTKSKLDDLIVDMVEEPFVFGTVVTGIWYGINSLNLSDRAEIIVGRGFYILVIFTVAWGIARIFDAIVEEYLVPLVQKTEGDLDDQLLPIVRKGLKLTIWIVAIIVAINNAGYDVGAILAGLGIGGLAFALAAQDTVANLFGGFTIFIDKPFTVNDRVKINGFDGMIREIGLRSTRLQTLEGRTVTIPNNTFTGNPVENVSSEPSRKVVLNLGLTYDTKPDKMAQALEILKSLASDHDNVEPDPLVSFNAFGDFSLGILFIYYIKPGADILGTQTEINLEILKQFNQNQLDMAFPTQTIITQAA